MTKPRYPFGGAAVRQPCASCTGAGYERSTEPVKQLPVLGRRHTCDDERDCTGAALAGDDLGADNRLYAESSRQRAPGWKYRRRVGSGAEGGADAVAQSLSTNRQQWRNRKYKIRTVCGIKNDGDLDSEYCECGDFKQWRQPAYAHREQVHGCVYVPTHRLTPKGVAV